MGFNINETITTKLHYEEVALITVALGDYQRNYESEADPEILKKAKSIVDRLGRELYDCKQENRKP